MKWLSLLTSKNCCNSGNRQEPTCGGDGGKQINLDEATFPEALWLKQDTHSAELRPFTGMYLGSCIVKGS